MSETQRTITALVLCTIILVAWQAYNGSLEPPPQPQSQDQQAQTAPAEGEDTKPADTVSENTNAPSDTPDSVAAPEDPTGETGEAPDAVAEVVPEKRVIPEATHVLETGLLKTSITNRGPGLSRVELKEYNERPKEDQNGEEMGPVVLTGSAPQALIRWDLAGAETNAIAESMEFGLRSEEQADLSGAAGDWNAAVSVKAVPDVYQVRYEISATNASSSEREASATITLSMPTPKQTGGGMFRPPINELNAVCASKEEADRKIFTDLKPDEDGPWTLEADAVWAGIDRQYFVMAAVPAEAAEAASLETAPATAKCKAELQEETLLVHLTFPPEKVAGGAEWKREVRLYLGPKSNDDLELIAPTLRDVINYNIWGLPLGAIARPMVYFLNMFHGWTGSWGLAIMLLTFAVKLVMFPITYKSAVSMRKMQLLRPEIDKIKQRYPDDTQRQQMEQMKLFKEKDVNMFGGCLPMLLQMPVWLALYRSLWTAVDLYQQSFLWLPDLTAKEPGISYLALALGGVTYAQQLLTPMSPGADNAQMKMMRYIMPGFLTFVMWSLPSGLVLYVFVNSLLSIGQQLVINKTTVQAK